VGGIVPKGTMEPWVRELAVSLCFVALFRLGLRPVAMAGTQSGCGAAWKRPVLCEIELATRAPMLRIV